MLFSKKVVTSEHYALGRLKGALCNDTVNTTVKWEYYVRTVKGRELKI